MACISEGFGEAGCPLGVSPSFSFSGDGCRQSRQPSPEIDDSLEGLQPSKPPAQVTARIAQVKAIRILIASSSLLYSLAAMLIPASQQKRTKQR
jgi:hypothetical protein